MNYVALRHWRRVVRELRIGPKRSYLVLDLALALTVLAIVGAGTPMVLYLLATGLLAGLVYRATLALAASAISTAGYGAILWTRIGYVPGNLDFHTTVTLPSVLLTVGAAGVGVRRLMTEQARSTAEVARLRQTAAVREERLRMARDLHDSLTKNLHGVWLLSRSLEAALDRDEPASARAAARVIGETAQSLAEEARSVIRGLREQASSSIPLVDALRLVAFRATNGHPISVEVSDRRLPHPATGPDPMSRFELLAVATEALHNTVKHAAASRVSLVLDDADDGLSLTVADDGKGFANQRLDQLPHEGHFGMLGMQERAARVGGALTVQSVPDGGTTVRLTLPGARTGRPAAAPAPAPAPGKLSGGLENSPTMATRHA
jgi:signal transduction histidine kinase